ncbi:hypothetical protein EVAR_25452_1 [Eumeta japonica]|uniref:Uncharacterized protein n=1 Tax=Eumeta variegata TaxID=151549 RepID=A0A4C1VNA4_EUMVA|nr:hypothetical protein EVAR_25452_1 [Eumeta japonica]
MQFIDGGGAGAECTCRRDVTSLPKRRPRRRARAAGRARAAVAAGQRSRSRSRAFTGIDVLGTRAGTAAPRAAGGRAQNHRGVNPASELGNKISEAFLIQLRRAGAHSAFLALFKTTFDVKTKKNRTEPANADGGLILTGPRVRSRLAPAGRAPPGARAGDTAEGCGLKARLRSTSLAAGPVRVVQFHTDLVLRSAVVLSDRPRRSTDDRTQRAGRRSDDVRIGEKLIKLRARQRSRERGNGGAGGVRRGAAAAPTS